MKGIKRKRKYEKVEKFDLRAAPERLLQVLFSLFFTIALRALFLLLCRSRGASFFFFSPKMLRKSEQNPTLDVMRRPYLVPPPPLDSTCTRAVSRDLEPGQRLSCRWEIFVRDVTRWRLRGAL
jgi:hypothetical protein